MMSACSPGESKAASRKDTGDGGSVVSCARQMDFRSSLFFQLPRDMGTGASSCPECRFVRGFVGGHQTKRGQPDVSMD